MNRREDHMQLIREHEIRMTSQRMSGEHVFVEAK